MVTPCDRENPGSEVENVIYKFYCSTAQRYIFFKPLINYPRKNFKSFSKFSQVLRLPATP